MSGAKAQAINWLVATYGQIPDDQNALNVASAIRTFLHEADGNGDAPGTNLYRNAQPYLDLLRGYVPPASPAASQLVGLAIETDPTNAALGRLTLTSVPIATIPVSTKYRDDSEAEDGLLGLAADPNFAKNGWVYMYFSPPGEPRNVLARFTLAGNTLDLASRKILLEVKTQRDQCCHTGGSIAFDAKGNLFLSTGDNTSPRAVSTSSLLAALQAAALRNQGAA